jgi:DNA polymerase elongation subunit (family B)
MKYSTQYLTQFKSVAVSLTVSGTLLLPILPSWAQSSTDKAPTGQGSSQDKFFDDTIIITLSPGANMDEVNRVIDDVHAKVVRKMHVEKENYWILVLKPEVGKVTKTYEKLVNKKDKNFRAVDRNYSLKPATP